MRHFFFALCAVAVMAFSVAAQAQDTGTKIAVADVQTVMGTSKAGKSIQEQIAKQRDSFKDEFGKLEKELADTQKKLTEQKDLKPEEAAAKQKEFETKLRDANGLVQQRRQSLEKAASEAMNTLRREIVKVVAGIAQEEKYDLVLSSQNVIVSQDSMDITERVLKKLDKDFPDVKLQLESAAAPAEAPKAKKK